MGQEQSSSKCSDTTVYRWYWQLQDILLCLQVHKRSFQAESEEGRDVRKHLAAVRSSILKGVHLVFSHIFPQNTPEPHSHPMWRLAEEVVVTLTCCRCHFADRNLTSKFVASRVRSAEICGNS